MFSLVICIKDACNRNEFIEPFPHPPPRIPAFFFAFWQQEPTNYWVQVYEHKQKQNINVKLRSFKKNLFTDQPVYTTGKKQTMNEFNFQCFQSIAKTIKSQFFSKISLVGV